MVATLQNDGSVRNEDNNTLNTSPDPEKEEPGIW